MGTIRVAQRSFAAGELDESFSGLANSERYNQGLRKAIGVLFSKLGTVVKRWGSLNLDRAEEIAPRMILMEIPAEGPKVIELGGTKFVAWDAVTRTQEQAVTYSSEWDSAVDYNNAYPVAFANQLWLFHPDQPTLIIERDAAGTWTVTSIDEKTAFISPLLAPRPLSTTMTRTTGGLTAGTSYFRPADITSGGSYWFLGAAQKNIHNSGWVFADSYESKTILGTGAATDLDPTATMTSEDWAGPWIPQGTYSNSISISGTPAAAADTTITLTGGETASPTDVGMIIALSSNVRLAVLVTKYLTSTTLSGRVIDANGGTLGAAHAGAHQLYRPRFREYDGDFLLPDDHSGNNKNLFSSSPMMASGMVATTNARDARFALGNDELEVRVDTFVDVNNVTADFEGPATWVARDLAPRINWSPLMSDYHGWPGAGAIHQGRMVMSAFKRLPNSVVGSRVDQPLNYRRGNDDADSFTFQIELQQGAVAWLASAQDLFIGTTQAEYVMRGTPITPSNVKVELQTSYGGLRDKPLIVQGAAMFVTRCGCGLREMEFRFERDRFAAPDATDLNSIWDPIPAANTIFRQPTQVKEPEPIVFTVGDSNELTALTYRRENGVVGWSTWRFSLHPSQAEANRDQLISMVAVPTSSDRDELWISTRRYEGAGFTDFIEIMRDDMVFDCQSEHNPISTTVANLVDYTGREVAVIADGVWLGKYTVVADGIDLSNHLGATPSVVTLGYEIPCEFEPQVLQVDQADGQSDGRMRTIKDALLTLVASYGGEIGFISGTDGGNDVEQFHPIFPEVTEGTTLANVTFTGVKKSTVKMGGEEARPIIRPLGPFPFELSAISLAVEISD